MAIERQAAFSYASLAPDVRARVETATRRLHDLERRTSESIIEMGQHLIEVKATIGHGNFLPWLEAEFGWHRDTANNLMQVAQRFANVGISDIHPSALYVLAAPSTPDEVRVEFTELAALGKKVTHKDVKARIDEAKEKPINTATVDSDTGEILDDEPAVESEQVDPNDIVFRAGLDVPPVVNLDDPHSGYQRVTPAKPTSNGTATAAVSRAESIAARLVKELGRSLALEVADQIYEIAGE